MGHALQAFVFTARPPALTGIPSARAIPLRQGLYLLPIIDAVFDQAQVAFPAENAEVPPFSKLSNSLLHLAREIAAGEVFAYIETEYCGGEGVQSAGVWRGEGVELTPRQQESDVVNEALRLLGASRGDHHDEFDAIGLGRHRATEAWLESLEEGQREDGYPTFDDAVSKLCAFLRQQKLPDDIRWVTIEDCARDGPQLFLRIPDQGEAETHARAAYEGAVSRRLGVKLAMLCTAKKTSCCYVYAPATAQDSEHALMPDGLKLSVPEFAQSAKLVRPDDLKTWKRLCALPDHRWVADMFE